jgi:hypothetical protein
VATAAVAFAVSLLSLSVFSRRLSCERRNQLRIAVTMLSPPPRATIGVEGSSSIHETETLRVEGSIMFTRCVNCMAYLLLID